MRLPGSGDRRKQVERNPAATDAERLAEESVPLVDRARGSQWYEALLSEVDLAALKLCKLRRASAGQQGRPQAGDEAVRRALGRADPKAVVWLASRAISYMDENGYPEDVEALVREHVDPERSAAPQAE